MTLTQQPVLNKRRALGAKSRDEILNAALTTMALYGYDGTSISRIATESGLPSSSIYWHFSSKAGVLNAVMRRGADRFFSFEGAAAVEGLSPRERFRQQILGAGQAAEANPEFLRLLFLLVLSGGTDEVIAAHTREVVDMGKARLHEAIAAAYIDEGTDAANRIANEMQDFAQGAFDGMFMAVQTHPGVRHVDLMERLVEALLAVGDGIRARSQAAPGEATLGQVAPIPALESR